MKDIIIKENEAGQRLDKFLRKYMKEAPDSFLHKMLRKKNITLNNKKAEGNEKLSVGDQIRLFLADETVSKFSGTLSVQNAVGEEFLRAYEQLGSLEIVFENHHVLIVNKPAGILTQKAEPADISLNEWLIGYLLTAGQITKQELLTFKPSVVNRLDRNTSGMVICGKTLLGSQEMSRLIKERKLHKFYRLIVKGNMQEAATLKGYLVKNEQNNKVRIVPQAEHADYIETAYKPVKNYRELALIEAELITGKTHQIRLHLAGIGHPLLGDYKYGDQQLNDRYKKQYAVKSQLLCAYRLEFPPMEDAFADMSKRTFFIKLPAIFQRLDEKE